MNLFKQCLTIAILLLSLPAIGQHSYLKQKINADSAWQKLNLIGFDGKNFIEKQDNLLKYRAEGLKFWKKFPDDLRRYDWLYSTLTWGPVYWKNLEDSLAYKHLLKDHSVRTVGYNLPLDGQKLKEWESIYPDLKKELLNYYSSHPKLKEDYELKLIEKELFEFLIMSLNKAYRPNGKADLNKLKTLFLSSEKYLRKEDPQKPTRSWDFIFNPMDANFIACYQQLDLDKNDMHTFFNSIKDSSVPVLKDWAIQRSSLFALMNEPIELKHKSIEGDLIDLTKLRGKTLLIDIWATWCSTCIARMPAIKTVYDKYKQDGFKVISVCLNTEKDIVKVKEVEKKIGADWPILVVGGETEKDRPNSLGNQIFRKYGFWGVPQLLLLNKRGKLVMLNDKLRNGDFEPIVKQLLAEKYN